MRTPIAPLLCVCLLFGVACGDDSSDPADGSGDDSVDSADSAELGDLDANCDPVTPPGE